jgi:23S rRNA (uracil1939-C5)-methyltransferase
MAAKGAPGAANATTPPETGVFEVDIAALGQGGDGIAHANGRAVFVPYSVPGDRLLVRAEGERDGGILARILDRLADGPERVQPPCPHFGDCGGCDLQQLSAAAYLAWKQGLVSEALSRRGIETEVAAMIVVPPGSRRRAVFIAERLGRDIHLGFNAAGSRRIVDLATCHILLPELVRLLPALRDVLGLVLGPRQSADIAATATDSGIDLWLKTRRPPSPAARQALITLAEAQDLARVSVGPDAEPVVIRRQPRAIFAGVAVGLPPDAFLQPSLPGERVLTRIVEEALAGRRAIADLYAGCGTFTFALAAGRKIHAVEANAAALAALAAAARAMAGRITAERRDLAREPLGPDELKRFDAVVFDPPRAGAKEQAAAIARSRLECAVNVSCHPRSFARDARILIDGGFRLQRVVPVDQFPWSAHLELVGIFRR